MTTIELSVFINLSGAAPLLLNRVLELINNPKLSSLEPLRQALYSGDFIVREVTDADNIPSRAHASFVDPKTDPITGAILAPGAVLLRKENLASASDASVLQFVDDIFHEGRGHGGPNQVAGRSSAASDLASNSNGFSTIERGDRYVNSWIDDETISRYTAFTFRQELATLSTEYTASNRAVLQTDETYRAFTRLSAVADEMGLIGDDKKAYIVEMARPVVSAYNDHFYRDTAVHHVLKVLNLNGTEAGTAYVDHVAETLNVVGYSISDVVMHDDGSSSASVVYENGDRRDLVFDSSGSLSTEQRTTSNGNSTTMRYDARGHLMSSTETDGAHNDADYASRTTTYDAQGREDWRSTLNDDGSKDNVDFDQSNVRADTTWSNHIDAQGREDWSRAVNDDGSVDWTDYDQTNVRGDRIWSNRTDAQGREDWRIVTNDDGSKDSIDFDQSNIRSDSIWSNHVDAQGREDWVSMLNDDGSRDNVDFDQTNIRFDRTWSNHIDAQGREDWSRALNDDGSVDWTDYDQTNVRGDRIWSNRTDAQGREDWRIVTNDDGSKDSIDFDQSNIRSDSIWSNHVDAQGREDWVSVLNDDGSRDNVDFDQTNVRADTTWSNHIDAQGREDWRNVINDNGRRDWTDFDQDGSQGWNRAESHYDAQGREDYTDFFMDDGRRNSYDYDQDGSHGWSRFESSFDASGRLDTSTRFFDDGSRFFFDLDHFGPNHGQMLGYDAQGKVIFLGVQVRGAIDTIFGEWKPAYGEGIHVSVVFGGSGVYHSPSPAPVLTPMPISDFDPYPNAHAEVGPIEPAW